MALRSEFFTSKRMPATRYRDSDQILTHGGIKLIDRRKQCIGRIAHNRDTGEFEVSVVNSADKLFMAEFKTFAEADRYAWISATSLYTT